MTRNTSQRVEVATPVYDYKAKMKLNKIMKLALWDNQKARRMDCEGNYTLITPSSRAKKHNSQLELYDEAYKNSADNIINNVKIINKAKTVSKKSKEKK